MKIRVHYRWQIAKSIDGKAFVSIPDDFGGCSSIEDYISNHLDEIHRRIAEDKNIPYHRGNFDAAVEVGFAEIRPL